MSEHKWQDKKNTPEGSKQLKETHTLVPSTAAPGDSWPPAPCEMMSSVHRGRPATSLSSCVPFISLSCLNFPSYSLQHNAE